MPDIDKGGVNKNKNSDHAPTVHKQLVIFLCGSQSRIEKHVVQQMPGDLGNEQRHREFDNPSDDRQNQIPDKRPDVSQKSNEIIAFCYHEYFLLLLWAK